MTARRRTSFHISALITSLCHVLAVLVVSTHVHAAPAHWQLDHTATFVVNDAHHARRLAARSVLPEHIHIPSIQQQEMFKRRSSMEIHHTSWFAMAQQLAIPTTSVFKASSYRVLPYLFVASATPADTAVSDFVSIATQYSLDVVHHVARLAASWQSRISVAVLAQRGLGVTHHLLARLQQCSEHVARLVDFHVVIAESGAFKVDTLYEDFKVEHDATVGSYMDIVGRSSGMFDEVTCARILADGLGVRHRVTKNYDAKVGWQS